MANRIPLGKVAFSDAGEYSASETYVRFDFVTTADSTYLSLKDDNKGHALTDKAWWICLANGRPATEAAGAANAAANAASAAATNATSAAALAQTKGNAAAEQAALASEATSEAEAATAAAEAMIEAGLDQIASMKAAEQALMSQALFAPTRMELKYLSRITLGNPAAQRIEVRLYPAYVLPNVIFQQAFYSGDAAYIDPQGNLTIRKTGTATFHIIPAQNTRLAQTVEVEVTAPVLRKWGTGLRTLSGGKLRLV